MLFTIIGIAGVVINLAAYALLTADRLQVNDRRYQLLNIIGTTGILLSLITQWNLPVFVLNAAWLTIALVGFTRIMLDRKRRKS